MFNFARKNIKSKYVIIFSDLMSIIQNESKVKKTLIEKWIKRSIENAKKNMIKGKELTPYLIQEINALSNNKTLETNIELIINNAHFAGKLAYNFYKIT